MSVFEIGVMFGLSTYTALGDKQRQTNTKEADVCELRSGGRSTVSNKVSGER